MAKVRAQYKLDKKYRVKTVEIDLPTTKYGFIQFVTLSEKIAEELKKERRMKMLVIRVNGASFTGRNAVAVLESLSKKAFVAEEFQGIEDYIVWLKDNASRLYGEEITLQGTTTEEQAENLVNDLERIGFLQIDYLMTKRFNLIEQIGKAYTEEIKRTAAGADRTKRDKLWALQGEIHKHNTADLERELNSILEG